MTRLQLLFVVVPWVKMIWSNIALEDEARVPTIDRQVDGRRGDPPVQQ